MGRRKSELVDVASVPIEQFPPSVRSLLAKFDKDGDGTVDAAELQEAAKMFEAAQCAEDGSIPIEQLPKELRPALKTFDMDGDGTIDPMELARGAELYAESKNTVKKLTRLAVGLILLLGVTVAAITGLTFVVVELSKETKAGADGTMLVNSDKGALMSTATQTINATLDSRMSDEALHSMQHFAVISPNGAHVRLNVLGTMRIPRKCQGEIGSLVIIVTAVGQITLEGTQMTFENEVGNYFAKAGFSVASSGRRLAGLTEIIAVFSSLKEVDYLGFDGCTDGSVPTMPENANYDYAIYYQCVDPRDELVDRCKHFGPEFTAVVEGERYAYINASAIAVKLEDGTTMSRRDLHMAAMAPDQIKTYIKITDADGGVETHRSYQTFIAGINSGNVTWCSDNQVFFEEGASHGEPDGKVVATYDGVVDDTPVVGGSTRKFTLHFEDEPGTVWEYYDHPETAEVAVVMQQSRLMGRTYYMISSVIPFAVNDVDETIFEVPEGACDPEDKYSPWIIPGTYRITDSTPFPHNQTLTATVTYNDDVGSINGEALLHEVLIASGATMTDYNAVVDELPEGATLEEIGAALETRGPPSRNARSLLAAEDGMSVAGRILDARDSYHRRWIVTPEDVEESVPDEAFDAHNGADVAETSALEEARKLQWVSSQGAKNLANSDLANEGSAAWVRVYAPYGDNCKGRKSTARHAEFLGIEFTFAKYWKTGFPCYLSGSAGTQLMAWPRVTVSADVDIDIDAEKFERIDASGSISFTVEGDIKAATLSGEAKFTVKGSVVKKGGSKWKYGGYWKHHLKAFGSNSPICYRPELTVSLSGTISAKVAGHSVASISLTGTMPIKFHTENCKDYYVFYWKTYFCGHDLYPMVHTTISIDGSYDILSLYSDSFNIWESDRIILNKATDNLWYRGESDCSICIYKRYGKGYEYLCYDGNAKWEEMGHPGK